jgi:isopenicillin N synthase-like dioxygenase
MASIPIIDLTPYFNGSNKQDVAQQIAHACETIGFFMISGHQIDPSLIQHMNASARQFFDQPFAEKQRVMADGGMGYIGPDGEKLAASLDDAQLQDVKESLNLTLPVQQESWPDLLPLRETAVSYITTLTNLSQTLMQLFALALDLEENWFNDKIDQPRTILRCLNYPPITHQEKTNTRAGAHTDYGTLTILWSPDSRGLQAQNRQGEWVDVIADPAHFIINIGDLMMNWTNDRWLSTLHQVVPHPETTTRRRQSLAFFHNPNPDALIECIDTCCSEQQPPKYKPMLAKTHLEMKISKSLGKNVEL